jgi:hypothetical protein
MNVETIVNPQSWAEQNFGTAELGDPRRTRRAVDTAAHLLNNPMASLPVQLQQTKNLKATYRLFEQKDVTFKNLSTPHWQQTRLSSTSEPVVLMVQDTTELDYSAFATTTGLGPIGDNRGRGFLLQTVLSVIPKPRQVLGIAAQEPFVRKTAPEGETRYERRKRNQKEGCESDIWGKLVKDIGQAPEGSRWVHVGDRGADIFTLMKECLKQRSDFLFRVAHNRLVQTSDETIAHLFSVAKDLPELDRRELLIPAEHERKARTATLALSYTRLQIQSPVDLPIEEPITASFVRVWELNAPEGVEPIEWLLLTSVAVESVPDGWECVEWYRCRWLVEDYHKCLKTGCNIQKRHLQSEAGLERLLAILAIVAVTLLQLRELVRLDPKALAHEVLSSELVNVVANLAKVDPQSLTVEGFWKAVAKKGGYLGRNGDGPPGWQTLWRGWLRIEDIMEGVRLAPLLPAQRCG